MTEPLSDERLVEIRTVWQGMRGDDWAPFAIGDLLDEVDRLRAENASKDVELGELRAEDAASYAMRQLVFDLAELDRASQFARRRRFNLTELVEKAKSAVAKWEAYSNAE